MTLDSSASAYATPADLLARYDARTVEQLASDTGVPVAGKAATTNANILAALADASGMLESAALASNRYTPADLNGLTGVAQNFLKMIVCKLAMGLLTMRRPMKDGPPAFYKEALDWLERLRDGERIFGILETAQAGEYQIADIREQDLAQLNLATYQAQRLFGARGNRFRQGTGI